MRSFLALVAIVAVGTALLVAPAGTFRLHPTREGGTVLDWWLTSLRTLAVPVVLVIFRLFHKKVSRISSLLWGAWLCFTTLYVLAALGSVNPDATLYGQFLVALTLILSVALVLFSTIEMQKK